MSTVHVARARACWHSEYLRRVSRIFIVYLCVLKCVSRAPRHPTPQTDVSAFRPLIRFVSAAGSRGMHAHACLHAPPHCFGVVFALCHKDIREADKG